LSLLNTGAIEQQTIQLVNQISVFLENHHIDSSKILKASDISSKINFNIIPNFLNAILATISFGMGLASVLFITFSFLKNGTYL
jgi:ABC-type dipeptide/oligopeptide/nickel transport system permease subunit